MSLLAAFRRPGILLLLPLLLALAARVFVAPGWMIESDAAGSITVRVCSDPANPGATMTIALERADDHQADKGQQHCPWGALAATPIVPGVPALPVAPIVAESAPIALTLLGFAPGIASPLPPSTGPPAFA
ncbi:hypothetical protein FHR22_002723 [Sphingopyxis panaciterrae]|uniref:DUF2946 family protein n=1 Tax=Sphingopyxis panaciterrae TaxID=363841 RepID=UPI00141F5D2B|nr:DUF2946 family protein [Sphingopyxis panaciterrae]NIJ38020.1 hypothetical protein [Sphingopyxis panaciterrae]